MNLPLITALTAIVFAQVIKVPIAYLSNRRKASVKLITSTGGMPSSHSAAVASLITALVLEYGFSSPFVAIATIFGVIVMFDSMGVRRQTGDHGIVVESLINEKLEDLKDDEGLSDEEREENYAKIRELRKYKDLASNKYLGHKPTEVIMGVFTGYLVAIFMYKMFYK